MVRAVMHDIGSLVKKKGGGEDCSSRRQPRRTVTGGGVMRRPLTWASIAVGVVMVLLWFVVHMAPAVGVDNDHDGHADPPRPPLANSADGVPSNNETTTEAFLAEGALDRRSTALPLGGGTDSLPPPGPSLTWRPPGIIELWDPAATEATGEGTAEEGLGWWLSPPCALTERLRAHAHRLANPASYSRASTEEEGSMRREPPSTTTAPAPQIRSVTVTYGAGGLSILKGPVPHVADCDVTNLVLAFAQWYAPADVVQFVASFFANAEYCDELVIGVADRVVDRVLGALSTLSSDDDDGVGTTHPDAKGKGAGGASDERMRLWIDGRIAASRAVAKDEWTSGSPSSRHPQPVEASDIDRVFGGGAKQLPAPVAAGGAAELWEDLVLLPFLSDVMIVADDADRSCRNRHGEYVEEEMAEGSRRRRRRRRTQPIVRSRRTLTLLSIPEGMYVGGHGSGLWSTVSSTIRITYFRRYLTWRLRESKRRAVRAGRRQQQRQRRQASKNLDEGSEGGNSSTPPSVRPA